MVSVKNNDLSTFGPSTFSLAYSVPTGWSASLSKTSVTTSPGGTNSSVTLSVTSPFTASVGNHTLSVTATNTGATSYQGSATATYTVSISYTPLLLTMVIAAVIIAPLVVMARRRTKRREKMKKEILDKIDEATGKKRENPSPPTLGPQ